MIGLKADDPLLHRSRAPGEHEVQYSLLKAFQSSDDIITSSFFTSPLTVLYGHHLERPRLPLQ